MINIILYRPEKPQNTGNILRTCRAIGAYLHIIGPLSFKMNDASLKRAGLDYIQGADYELYSDYETFVKKVKAKKIYYITRYGFKAPSMVDFRKDVGDLYFMFGRESTGIPKEILQANLATCLRLPMKANARSLNLANCVAVVAYEALRQLDYEDLATEDFLKGEDYLLK
ncbi:tRNA (cytidine(34)-2'-O)-methyltransferase [bacterium]|jgi:tRNA (cytidine/uridine-2'-O-)-methyltransferase|nr:tRNA (cytidine(34)-2'-O)-methyltransferase [bacterium]